MQKPDLTCPQCGTRMPNEAAVGVCPVCALRGVLREPADSPKPSDPFLRGFGDYQFIEEIARGGMGVVYKARQESLGRIVAVKTLLFGSQAREEDIKRFRLEASAAASLKHPHIVAIHEVGVHAGQQYLVMDYVEGPTLADLISNQPLPAMQAAGYLKTVAEAIHYAHERGILHRDLKPSNVLIDSNDQPHVTDFGLAKRLTDSQTSTLNPRLTLTGQVIGSPNYMAPEQAAARSGRVSRTTDVYALGALLYHLITGRPPFASDSLAKTLQQVLEAEPDSPRLLNPGVPRDLETICLKCLEKEPRRRYQTAQGLAEELGRVLLHEPIHARRASGGEKAWRWCQRRPAVAILAGATCLLLLTVLLGSPVALFRINKARAAEQTARQQAEAQAYTSDMNIVQQAWAEGDLELTHSLLTAHIPKAGQPDLRDFEWRYLWNLCQDESRYAITNKPGEATFSLVTSTNHSFVIAGSERAVILLNGTTGQELDRMIEADPVRRLSAIACSPGIPNVVATGDDKGDVSLWDIAAKRVLGRFQAHTNRIANLALSPDGRFLASSDWEDADRGSFKVWEIKLPFIGSQTPVWQKNLSPKLEAFNPDGQTLVTDGQPYANGILRVWEVKTGREPEPIPAKLNGHVYAMALSADGKLLAASGVDNRIFVWGFPERHLRSLLTNQVPHLGPVTALAFSWDGAHLASGGYDNTVRIWDFASEKQTMLRGHRGQGIRSLTFGPDGRTILSTSGHELKVWEPQKPPPPPALVLDTHQTMRGISVSPDFKWLITNKNHEGTNQNPKVWDLAAGANRFELSGSTDDPIGRAFSPDGRILALGSEDLRIRFWDTASWPTATSAMAPFETLTNDFEPGCLSFSPNGKILAVAGRQVDRVKPSRVTNRLAFWDLEARKKLGILKAAGAAVSETSAAGAVAFANDGRIVAVAYKDGWMRLWDRTQESLVQEFHEHTNSSWYGVNVFFSRDGHWLALSSISEIVLYDIRSLPVVRRCASWDCRHRGGMSAATFAPGSAALVTSGNDGRIKFWNLTTREVALTLVQGHGPYATLNFSADGNKLCSSDGNGIVKLWVAAPAEAIR